MKEEQEAISELAQALAQALAVSLAEWESFLQRAEAQADSRLEEEASMRARVLLSLARSLEEYDDESKELPHHLQPAAALPLAYALGASYALLALGSHSPELLLSPHRLGVLLTPECAEFIKRHGEAEALRLLK